MKKLFRAVPLLMVAALLLLAGCGETTPAADGGVPTEAKMMEIAERLMPEVTKISMMQNGNLEHNYEDIIGVTTYLEMDIHYARVTDPAYPDWATLTGYYKSVLTDNYMNAHYMAGYLLSAEDAKGVEMPLMYQEFDGVLGRNIDADGAGMVEYAVNTSVFSDVTAHSFTAAMDSMDGYGSKVTTTAVFVMGQDGNWRVDSVDNQWSD